MKYEMPVHIKFNQKQFVQECIPVGCVPPALYRLGGSP